MQPYNQTTEQKERIFNMLNIIYKQGNHNANMEAIFLRIYRGWNKNNRRKRRGRKISRKYGEKRWSK